MDTGDITSDHTDSPTPETASVNGRVMVVSLDICFAALFIITFYHLYIRLYLCNSRGGGSDLLPDRRRRRQPWSHDQTSAAAAGKGQGLPSEILKALPTFQYSEAECTECAVCLSEFEDGETGRVLPGCGHWFHVECIDMWFATHSNCPLCRAPVQPVEPSSELTSIKIEALGEVDGVNRYYPGCSSGSSGPTVEPK